MKCPECNGEIIERQTHVYTLVLICDCGHIWSIDYNGKTVTR